MDLLKVLQDKGARLAGRFYDLGTDCRRKLGDLPGLSPFLSGLERTLKKRPAALGIELFVALSLSAGFFYFVRPTCGVAPDGNAMGRQTFAYLSAYADPAAKEQIQLNWRKRLAGPLLSACLLDWSFNGRPDIDGGAIENLFALYQTGWLLLLFLAIILYHSQALLVMLGIFGGVTYYLSGPGGPQFFVWDMPTMFFFTLACLVYSHRSLGLLAGVIWLGSLFKETTLCCALLILLGEHWPLRKRLAGFVGTVIASFATYEFLMWLYNMNTPVLAMNHATTVHDWVWNSLLAGNLYTLFSLNARHVVFANAGALLIMMLLPWKNRRDVVFKLLIVVFIIGEFFWGAVDEFRIWLELLPLGWMMIADFLKERPVVQDTTAGDKESNRVLIGSYWLMMGALLAVAVVIWAATKTAQSQKLVDDAANHLSVQELLLAAPQGNTAAQYRLGQAYQLGFGVKKDPDEAALWFQRAAEKGHLDAQNALGMLLAAERNDYSAAAQWFSRAAEGGNAEAQYNLGLLHQKGLGVARNDELAFQWFQKSALQGQVIAEKEVGQLYQLGRGVNRDYVAAYQWLKLAQLQGDEEATGELNACSALMTTEQIATAEKLVRKFRAQGVSSGR